MRGYYHSTLTAKSAARISTQVFLQEQRGFPPLRPLIHECGAKGALLVQVKDDEVTVERLILDRARWFDVTVDVEGLTGSKRSPRPSQQPNPAYCGGGRGRLTTTIAPRPYSPSWLHGSSCRSSVGKGPATRAGLCQPDGVRTSLASQNSSDRKLTADEEETWLWKS